MFILRSLISILLDGTTQVSLLVQTKCLSLEFTAWSFLRKLNIALIKKLNLFSVAKTIILGFTLKLSLRSEK